MEAQKDSILRTRLAEIERIAQSDLDEEGVRRVLELIEAPVYPAGLLAELKLYSELLPLVEERPFTRKQRFLHFLWDAFDKLPICLFSSFGILYRRIIAQQLFKRCGHGFIAEENCRFNFGQNIEVGDFVFFNRGVYIDSKGGVTIGDQVCLTEDVKIFTHSHSEASHILREYHPVVIEDYAKIYTGATILPGVTVGEQAIVASQSLVNQDVPPNMVVAGMPAKPVRKRATDGRKGDELDHIWLF